MLLENAINQKWLETHFDVSRETFDRLIQFKTHLKKWQSAINLVSDTSFLWSRHIVDSLQLLPLIPPDKTVADIGSGGGFPGLVLGICGLPNIHLIESDKRKAIFLKEAARITETEITVHNARAEEIKIENCGLITSRACASLSALLSLSQHLRNPDASCLFLKGKNHLQEVEEAKKNWTFAYKAHPSCTDNEGVILEIGNIQRI